MFISSEHSHQTVHILFIIPHISSHLIYHDNSYYIYHLNFISQQINPDGCACQVGPQESLTGIEKLFLPWVPMNILKDWKAKLESAYSFMLKCSKITVCLQTFPRVARKQSLTQQKMKKKPISLNRQYDCWWKYLVRIHSSFPFKKNLSSSVMPEGEKNWGCLQ